MQYPRNFLKRAFDSVRKRGGVCIADEVRNILGLSSNQIGIFVVRDNCTCFSVARCCVLLTQLCDRPHQMSTPLLPSPSPSPPTRCRLALAVLEMRFGHSRHTMSCLILVRLCIHVRPCVSVCARVCVCVHVHVCMNT